MAAATAANSEAESSSSPVTLQEHLYKILVIGEFGVGKKYLGYFVYGYFILLNICRHVFSQSHSADIVNSLLRTCAMIMWECSNQGSVENS